MFFSDQGYVDEEYQSDVDYELLTYDYRNGSPISLNDTQKLPENSLWRSTAISSNDTQSCSNEVTSFEQNWRISTPISLYDSQPLRGMVAGLSGQYCQNDISSTDTQLFRDNSLAIFWTFSWFLHSNFFRIQKPSIEINKQTLP